MTGGFKESGVGFKIDGKVERFGPQYGAPVRENGGEYKRFLYVIGVLNDSIRAGRKEDVPFCYWGDHQKDVENRFGGKDSFFLIREQEKIAGFPDFVLVREEMTLVCDHFSIDGSKQLGTKKGTSAGTEFQRLTGSISPKQIEQHLRKGTIDFREEYLAGNLRRMLSQKANRFITYDNALDQYFRDGSEIYDMLKPRETWLLIEDQTPYFYRDAICREIASFFCRNSKVRGILYFHDEINQTLPIKGQDLHFFFNGQPLS